MRNSSKNIDRSYQNSALRTKTSEARETERIDGMRANFCVFAALAVGASVARATGGGGGIGVGTRGLQAIADAIEPTLVAEIRALKVPDVKTNAGGFKVHLFDMHVGSFQCDSPCIVPTFDAGGAIGLKLPGFHIVFHFVHGRDSIVLGLVRNGSTILCIPIRTEWLHFRPFSSTLLFSFICFCFVCFRVSFWRLSIDVFVFVLIFLGICI